jgi:hypothetical protein
MMAEMVTCMMILLCFRIERYGDFSGKRPFENGVWVFRRPYLINKQQHNVFKFRSII